MPWSVLLLLPVLWNYLTAATSLFSLSHHGTQTLLPGVAAIGLHSLQCSIRQSVWTTQFPLHWRNQAWICHLFYTACVFNSQGNPEILVACHFSHLPHTHSILTIYGLLHCYKKAQCKLKEKAPDVLSNSLISLSVSELIISVVSLWYWLSFSLFIRANWPAGFVPMPCYVKYIILWFALPLIPPLAPFDWRTSTTHSTEILAYLSPTLLPCDLH